MAAEAEQASADVISLDILEGVDIDSADILPQEITHDQAEQVFRVIDEFEGVNSRELIDFSTQEEQLLPQRHKQVTDSELDRLASKNSAESTAYQTRWAITVFKGTFNQYFCLILAHLHETRLLRWFPLR